MNDRVPSTTTTSIRNVPLRTVTDVVVDVEEETKLRKQLARLGYAPEPWCGEHGRTDRQVIAFLRASPIEMPLPDALDLVGRHGAAICEGAVIWTLAHMRGEGKPVKKPRGLLLWAIERGKTWTAAQVELFIEEEWGQVTQRAKRVARDEDNAELLALFGEEIAELPTGRELDAAVMPKNITRLAEAR